MAPLYFPDYCIEMTDRCPHARDPGGLRSDRGTAGPDARVDNDPEMDYLQDDFFA